ncbi:MAG: tetratricopeptide repeat protein [Thiohalomonadales bacterium]
MKKIIYLLLLGVFANVSAMERSAVAVGFEDDYMLQDRFKLYMGKAVKGQARAQYSVGEMLEKGRGTQVDASGAYDWYKKAAEQRHIKAQFKLGYMQYFGLGVQKNINKAFKQLQHPANKGNVRAQYYLGKLYAKGHGVAQDPKKAIIWYSRASIGGFAPAEEELVIIKKLMAKIDETRKLAKKPKQKSKSPPIRIAKADITKNVFKPTKIEIMASRLKQVVTNIQIGGWKNRKRPAEFLPSKITSCTQASDSMMECLSRRLLRNNGSADIIYITKALLFDINDAGEFKVAYRNNVLDVIEHDVSDDEDSEDLEDEEDTDEEDEADSKPRKSTVKKGWQETEHQLECKIKTEGSISCVKNKMRKLLYKRKLDT